MWKRNSNASNDNTESVYEWVEISKGNRTEPHNLLSQTIALTNKVDSKSKHTRGKSRTNFMIG